MYIKIEEQEPPCLAVYISWEYIRSDIIINACFDQTGEEFYLSYHVDIQDKHVIDVSSLRCMYEDFGISPKQYYKFKQEVDN